MSPSNSDTKQQAVETNSLQAPCPNASLPEKQVGTGPILSDCDGKLQKGNGDWIKLHRRIVTSEVFDSPLILKGWIWLLTEARWGEGAATVAGRRFELKRGELAFTNSAMQAACKFDRKQVNYVIRRLKGMGKIGVANRSPNIRHVSINKFDTYQAFQIDHSPAVSNHENIHIYKKKEKNKSEPRSARKTTSYPARYYEICNRFCTVVAEHQPNLTPISENKYYKQFIARGVRSIAKFEAEGQDPERLAKAINFIELQMAEELNPFWAINIKSIYKLIEKLPVLSQQARNRQLRQRTEPSDYSASDYTKRKLQEEYENAA